MGLTKKLKQYLTGAALGASLLFSQTANADEEERPSAQRIQRAAVNAMRDEENSLLPAAEGMHLNMGGSIDDLIFNYMFRVPGRVRWAQNYPNTRFGHHRENSRDLNWRQHDSRHFSFFTTNNQRLRELVPLAEETYDDFSSTMDVRTFNDKIRVHYFSDRIEFEQMGMFPGLVPEGLGGITQIMDEMHNKVVFLNEGEREFMYHVGRHELAHRFRMEQFRHVAHDDMTNQMPLWFIEGIAEHDSLRMDPSIDASVRDAYFNGFLELGLSPMLRGTRFMYDAGTVYVNYIGDHFGENSLNKIVTGTARGLSFESSLRRATGLSSNELSRRVNEELTQRFGNRFRRDGLEDLSNPLGQMVVLAADENNFILGKNESLQDGIYIGRRVRNRWVTERIDADEVPGSDSLHRFRHGADILEDRLAYVVRNGTRDAIRIKRFNFENNEFEVNDGYELGFDNISFIKNPRMIDYTKIAFVGMENGNMNLYLYDLAHRELRKLTEDDRGIRGMDYNRERNSIVFSLESELRTNNPSKCDFNYDLYELDLNNNNVTRLTETDFDETNPSVSPNGKRIAFNTSEHGSRDIAIFDYNIPRTLGLPNIRIGASAPQWRTNNRLAFNSIREMSPASYSFNVPDSVTLLHANLRWATRPNRAANQLGNIQFREGNINVRHHGRNFSVNQAVASNDAFYLAGTSNDQFNIFRVDERSASAILPARRKSLESLLETNEQARETYGRFRENNTIIRSSLSPDERYIFTTVNNRLSMHSRENRADYPVTVFRQDLETNEVRQLPDLELDSVDNFKKLIPLENGRALAYVTNPRFMASTEHEYLIYNPSTNRFENLNAELLTPDRNQRFLVGVKSVDHEDKVFVYDSHTQQRRFVNLDIDDYQTLNITQTTSGEFLIREEGAHNNCEHYALLNPEDLSFRRFNFEGKLKGSRIVTDMLRLDDGRIAMIERESERSGNSALGELYIIEDGQIKRTLRRNREVSLLGHDESTLLVSNGRNIVAIDAETHIGNQVVDAEMSSDLEHIVYSDILNVYTYDVTDNNHSRIRNTFGFDVNGTKLAYAVYRNGNYDVMERNLKTGQTRAVSETRLNEILPLYVPDGRIVSLNAPERESRTTSLALREFPSSDRGLVRENIRRFPIDYMQLSLQGVASTRTKFLMMDFSSTDMLQERIFNLSYMGNIDQGSNFGTISYADISQGYGISAAINQFGGNLTTGINGTLIFPQSRFTQLDLNLGYDYQDLHMFDFSGPNHVIKVGLGYGHDASLRGILGPRDGERLSAYTELGFSLNHQTLSNADIYVAARKYFNFGDYAYLALAADAGTSQGISPTLILNGGNMSLRGVNFGELMGNNIAMARSEIRLNIIEAAGIHFAKPIELLSILSLTPIPEIGWYNDIGATWYQNVMASDEANRESGFKLYYGGGPTLNINTFLGLTARLNFPAYGNAKEWNFWLGYVGSNW